MAVGADHLQLDIVRRRLRQPSGWLAIVLHLSQVDGAAPRPHHRRISRALMEDTAQRHEGQVLAMGNGDLLLLCRAGDGGRLPDAGAARTVPASGSRIAIPSDLPGVLARLLRADAPDPARLVSLWPLETEAETLLAYAQARTEVAALGPADMLPTVPKPSLGIEPRTVDAVADLVGGADVADLLKRQTAVLLAGDRLQPLFRVVTFSMPALEARLSLAGAPASDPYLFRHLAERLDRRMLAVLAAALDTGGPLDLLGAAGALAGSASPHLALTLAGLHSPAFAQVGQALQDGGRRFGVEVPLLEAVADPAGLEDGRALLARFGGALVLSGVSPLSLRLARVAAFRPDLLKLDWEPRLETSDETAGPVRRLLREFDPDRILIARAETEAAVAWGLRHGVRRFQGRHVDAMLGASRLASCAHAGGCTLRQCIERAAAAGEPGRRLCRDHALLDSGLRVAA